VGFEMCAAQNGKNGFADATQLFVPPVGGA
jgi:hypothetical protein